MTELIAVVVTALAALCVTHRYSLILFLSSKAISVTNTHVEKHSNVKHNFVRSLNTPKRYRIEHVFLIDRESGMHIETVSSKYCAPLDSDAVSAMFSALQSFVQDTFCREKSSKLTDFRVGDHSIWLAHGPKLMLACVIVGEIPNALKYELDRTLKIIQSDFVASLSDMARQEEIAGVTKVMKSLLAR